MRGNPQLLGAPGSREWQQQFPDAEVAIRQIGTNGIPFLLKWVSYQPPRWLTAVRGLVCKEGSVDRPKALALLFRQEDRADGVFDAFLLLGAAAAPAIPDLAGVAANTQKPAAAQRARICIWAILMAAEKAEHDAPASPTLASALTNCSQIVREQALDVSRIVHSGSSFRFAPPPLIAPSFVPPR
jgi:hypothetical protein